MAEVTIFRRPGDLSVVTGTAILPLADFVHRYSTGTSLGLESDVDMANRALKADAMKPVREDYG